MPRRRRASSPAAAAPPAARPAAKAPQQGRAAAQRAAPPAGKARPGRCPPPLDGLCGLRGGTLFQPPAWVDVKLPPGHTAQRLSWRELARGVATLRFFFFSPNTLWCAIAGAVYLAFPYDFAAAARWDASFALQRLAIHTAVVGAFYAFWYVALYDCGCGRRKFRGARVPGSEDAGGGALYVAAPPSTAQMLHDVWYWALGVAQWTAWEVLFVHCYGAGKLPYLADAEVAGSLANLAAVVAVALALPLWRAFHFYFSHRFLHIRALYRFVHSLHHRNIDVEPFAGLCMHPVEHLYYFACVMPSLYMLTSPFIMLWNGYHLLLSPAASHSGWEDAVDQFHTIHHTTFEANYGSASFPFDALFGTFRERMGSSKAYRGAAASAGGDAHAQAIKAQELASRAAKPLRVADALPSTVWDGAYHAAFALSVVAMAAALTGAPAAVSLLTPRRLGLLVSVGPVVVALILRVLSGDRLPARWPFHKESLAGKLGWHLLIGAAVTVLPTYHLIHAAAAPPGQSVYYFLPWAAA